jgi:NAD(P)H dehydrogenase (quinone)
MTTFAITGASGNLGRLVADAVLETTRPADLVLVSREPAKLAAYAARGVQARRGDFADPATLAEAFAGVDRLLLISTDAVGERVPGHKAAVDAAVAAGVRWIGYTSINDPSDSNPAGVAADHRQTEDHIRASGAAWTFLRNSIYAEILAGSAHGAAAGGTLLTNAGAGAVSYVTRADCAAVAAHALVTGDADGKAIDVTGAEALGPDALAALIAEVSGREVTVTRLDDEGYVAALVEHAGLPEAAARLFASFGQAARLGFSDTVAGTVQDLLGRPPQPARAALEAAF